MSAFPRVLSYQNSFLGSKFVVIGVVYCQKMRRNALFHKVLRALTKYFAETRGTLMYSGLSEITSSSYYAALDDVGKLDAVNKMIELSNAVAKTGVSDYELKSWYAKANDGREQYGIRFSDFVLAYAAQSGTESLKDKDGDTITNSGSLRQMQAVYAVPGLSDKQRAYLFEACGVGKSVRHYNRVKVEEELRKMEQKAKK